MCHMMCLISIGVGGTVDVGGFVCAKNGGYWLSMNVYALDGCWGGNSLLWGSGVCVAGKWAWVLIETKRYIPRCSYCNP
jgi:hypothetical protein